MKNRRSMEGSKDLKFFAGSHSHCFPAEISVVATDRDVQGHLRSTKYNRGVSHHLPWPGRILKEIKRDPLGFNDHNINLERPPSSMKEAYSKVFSWILKPSAIKSEARLINKETVSLVSVYNYKDNLSCSNPTFYSLLKIKFTLAN